MKHKKKKKMVDPHAKHHTKSAHYAAVTRGMMQSGMPMQAPPQDPDGDGDVDQPGGGNDNDADDQ